MALVVVPLDASKMKRRNCWEVKKCGRQPGGEKVEELGVCPAAELSEYDGINQGTCGAGLSQAPFVEENHRVHLYRSL